MKRKLYYISTVLGNLIKPYNIIIKYSFIIFIIHVADTGYLFLSSNYMGMSCKLCYNHKSLWEVMLQDTAYHIKISTYIVGAHGNTCNVSNGSCLKNLHIIQNLD